jgi:hypothetical protein
MEKEILSIKNNSDHKINQKSIFHNYGHGGGGVSVGYGCV